MKQKDIKPLKIKIWLQNDKKCPVLNKEIPIEKMVLDHAHKNNNEEYSHNKGTIRTALDFRSNAVLGKLENSLKRTGLTKDPDFNISEFLRNAADYFERGAYVEDGRMFIHPSEVHKKPKISKQQYNILKKLVLKDSKKIPDFPKSKKLTKALSCLFKKYNISPFLNVP